MAEYIDATPTWSGILPVLLTVLHDGNLDGKRMAGEELRRMAMLADSVRDEVQEAEAWREKFERATNALSVCINALVQIEESGGDPYGTTQALAREALNLMTCAGEVEL